MATNMELDDGEVSDHNRTLGGCSLGDQTPNWWVEGVSRFNSEAPSMRV